MVRQFVDRCMPAVLSANPAGTLHHPGQVDQICRREDLADQLRTVEKGRCSPLASLRPEPAAATA
ncbi:hypothetical protein [Streptomyces sp. NPDC049590]|uniref:hypothetical protein n=1 Tax=Streptomyces sp. NPDC049590 TaxID=3154834 RepID=UPI003436940C